MLKVCLGDYKSVQDGMFIDFYYRPFLRRADNLLARLPYCRCLVQIIQ